jgi:hypothetical protein
LQVLANVAFMKQEDRGPTGREGPPQAAQVKLQVYDVIMACCDEEHNRGASTGTADVAAAAAAAAAGGCGASGRRMQLGLLEQTCRGRCDPPEEEASL